MFKVFTEKLKINKYSSKGNEHIKKIIKPMTKDKYYSLLFWYADDMMGILNTQNMIISLDLNNELTFFINLRINTCA